MADCGARDQLERGVVVHLVAAEHSAMAVGRVLAEADVGEEEQLGKPGPQVAEGPLDDPVVDPSAGALVVLLLGDPEQDHGGHARGDELRDLARQRVERVPGEAGQLRVQQRLRRYEQRHDEAVELEARLAHERTQRAGPAQPPQPCCGEGAHAANSSPGGAPRGARAMSGV